MHARMHALYLAPVDPDWFYLPGFTFLVPAAPGCPGQNPTGPLNGCVCACVCACVRACVYVFLLNFGEQATI